MKVLKITRNTTAFPEVPIIFLGQLHEAATVEAAADIIRKAFHNKGASQPILDMCVLHNEMSGDGSAKIVKTALMHVHDEVLSVELVEAEFDRVDTSHMDYEAERAWEIKGYAKSKYVGSWAGRPFFWTDDSEPECHRSGIEDLEGHSYCYGALGRKSDMAVRSTLSHLISFGLKDTNW